MKLLFKLIVLFNLILTHSIYSFGGDEIFSERIEGVEINTVGQMTTIDDQYYEMIANLNWPSLFTNIEVKNRVRLGLNPKVTLENSASMQVDIRVTSIDENGVETIYDRTLSVEYSSNGNDIITDLNTFEFEGGHKVHVEVLTSSPTSYPEYFYLQSEIEVKRYYAFDHTATVNSITQDDPVNANYLQIVWEHLPGAEEYEIEYVHINNYKYSSSTDEIAIEELDFNFYRNSIRIRSSQNFHRIPKTFDKGFFIHRVRAIGRNESDFSKDVNGKWNDIESGTIDQLSLAHRLQIFDEFDELKNWSYNLGLDDEGKRFEGVSYGDGLGRVRQSVSHNTETDQTIVAPRYYDSHGREVISSLPVPEDTEDLSYRNNFNYYEYDDNGTLVTEPVTGKEYDIHNSSGNHCDPNKIPFSKDYGAGKYYSENNPNQEGENAHIPNANKFPYSRVEYMQDQTGRIKRVGAFGEEFQIGGGQETIYYYSTPSQEELIRLFGSEVGKHNQYQKRLMSDANGQIYVEYYDLAGRVVASGMVGKEPANLQALEGNLPIENFTQTIISENLYDLTNEGSSVFYSKPEVITSQDNYSFEFLLTPGQYSATCMQPDFCFDCIYEVNLRIIEAECTGDAIYEASQITSGGDLNDCTSGIFSESITLLLDVGTYQFERTITIVEEAKEEYWCSYLDNTECVEDYFSVYNEFYDDAIFDDCEDEQASSYDVNPEYDGPQECLMLLETMLMDVSPGGQYALYEINGNGDYVAGTFNLSVYNSSNNLNAPSAFWRNPGGLNSEYKDDENTPALIPIQVLGPNNTIPELINNATIQTIGGQDYAKPEDLKHLKDFVDMFKPYWAHALVEYHPEYCYFQFCDQNSDFHDYRYDKEAIIEHGIACPDGLYNPLNQPYWDTDVQTLIPLFNLCSDNGTANEDLFFTIGGGLDYLNDLIYEMENYTTVGATNLDLWSYAYATVLDPAAAYDEVVLNDIFHRDVLPCRKDEIWLAFRDLYNDLRYKYYKMAELDFVMVNECYSGCFGDPAFNSSEDIVNNNSYDNYVLPDGNVLNNTNNTNQPCNNSDYTSKIPRAFDYFGLINQYPTNSIGDYQAIMDQHEVDVAASCSTSCATYAEDWINALTGCNFDQTTLDLLEADLIAFCSEGCSDDYPTGISSLPMGSTSTTTSIGFNSFEDILDHYLNGSINNACNIYLLPNLPPTYENPFEIEVSYLDDCGCDELFLVEQEFLALENSNNLPVNVTNIETFYYSQTGVWLNDLDGMICACNEHYNIDMQTWTATGIENLLNDSIIAPEGLACGSTSGDDCIDCAEMINLETEVDNYFLGQNISSASNYNKILMNYANAKLGFHLGESDYEDFLNQCTSTSSDPICELSDEGIVFKDLLNIIFKRGQIQTPSTNPIDLLTENVVYANSEFSNIFQGNNFWSCDLASCIGNSIDLYFGTDASDACDITLTLPASADFGFEDIVNIIEIEAINTNCSSGGEFQLYVEYFSCGVRQTAILTGISNCFDIGRCYCGGASLLCDDPYYTSLNGLGDCYGSDLSIISELTDDAYDQLIEEEKVLFFENYETACKSGFNNSSWSYSGGLRSYQFTLFYYDQAGNLVKTVAPEGIEFVDQVNFSAAETIINDATLTSSITDTPVDPGHNFKTVYEYNSYNQLVSTTNPDQQGNTVYWYDRAGRIVTSQNPEQASIGQYSYTFYDVHGRPEEVGQINLTVPATMQGSGYIISPLSEDDVKKDDLGAAFRAWVMSGYRTEITHTYYDDHKTTIQGYVNPLFEAGVQQNLRLRVASVVYFNTLTNGQTDIDNMTNYESATHYSYDPHGNVIETIQDVPMMAAVNQNHKSTAYEFELISGNMKKVTYQKDEMDEFTHEYCYDELNRLTEVHTNSDGIHKSRDAAYQYYDYGPIAREELGQYNVQGSDYTYTINGWLKGMNSNSLTVNNDMGKDATTGFYSNNTNVHQNYAKDVIGFSLGYYDGDYSPIGGNSFEAAYSGTDFGNGSADLFNGNIRHMVTAIDGLDIQGYAYTYDQLQRLKKMEVYRDANLQTHHNWSTATPTSDYLTQISYDKNGNITTLDRNGYGSELEMDRFTYHYYNQADNASGASSASASPGYFSNRLSHVADVGQDYADLSTQDPDDYLYDDIRAGNLAPGDYQYNKIGELISDASENMTLEWRLGDHKLKKITRTDQNSSNIEFVYNPLGVRVAKIEKPRANSVLSPQEDWIITYYTYDANGQLMATYTSDLFDGTTRETTLDEQYIYGSKRVGVFKKTQLVYLSNINLNPSGIELFDHEIGKKRYELSNHLGNVLATITDRKVWNNTDGVYEPVVTMYADYYAGGMIMPGRSFNESEYRYGAANGQEKVDEIAGSGNHYTAQYWEYDPRTMRRWNTDPVVKHHESPYATFANNPIWFADPNGADTTTNDAGRLVWEVEEGDSYWEIGEKLKEYGINESNEYKKIQGLNNQEARGLKIGSSLEISEPESNLSKPTQTKKVEDRLGILDKGSKNDDEKSFLDEYWEWERTNGADLDGYGSGDGEGGPGGRLGEGEPEIPFWWWNTPDYKPTPGLVETKTIEKFNYYNTPHEKHEYQKQGYLENGNWYYESHEYFIREGEDTIYEHHYKSSN